MASTAAQNYISLGTLLNASYSMIAVTSAFTVTRLAVRITRPKALAVEDALVLLSYVTFLVQTILYITIAGTIYKVSDVINGITPPYATLENDAMQMIRVFFANTLLFWCTLWLVKGSLLSLYWKLLGTNRIYRRLWWAVVIFCVVTFIGNVVSHLTSCSSISAWFTVGGCATPRDSRAQIISLYYAFAVDVLSDLMIMALPVGVMWNLQMAPLKKAGIITLFCIGWIAIATAIIRVVSIGVRAGSSTPSSTWLAFWATIEAGIAVVIATAPGLYSTARKMHTTRKESKYAGYHAGYQRHTGDASGIVSGSLSKGATSKIYATSSIDDDERQIMPTNTSFSRPIYLRPTTKAPQHGLDGDMELRPRDDWSSPSIVVTKQFSVVKH